MTPPLPAPHPCLCWCGSSFIIKAKVRLLLINHGKNLIHIPPFVLGLDCNHDIKKERGRGADIAVKLFFIFTHALCTQSCKLCVWFLITSCSLFSFHYGGLLYHPVTAPLPGTAEKTAFLWHMLVAVYGP